MVVVWGIIIGVTNLEGQKKYLKWDLSVSTKKMYYSYLYTCYHGFITRFTLIEMIFIIMTGMYTADYKLMSGGKSFKCIFYTMQDRNAFWWKFQPPVKV